MNELRRRHAPRHVAIARGLQPPCRPRLAGPAHADVGHAHVPDFRHRQDEQRGPDSLDGRTEQVCAVFLSPPTLTDVWPAVI